MERKMKEYLVQGLHAPEAYHRPLISLTAGEICSLP
jgi:hypothetical protein